MNFLAIQYYQLQTSLRNDEMNLDSWGAELEGVLKSWWG